MRISSDYLKNIYIKEKYLGNEYCKALLENISQLAIKRGCGRDQWLSDWMVYRLNHEKIAKIA
jgi:hypothetical protein